MAKSSMIVPKALAIIPFGIFLLFVDKGEEWLLGLIAIAVGVIALFIKAREKKTNIEYVEYKDCEDYTAEPNVDEEQNRIVNILTLIMLFIIVVGIISCIVLGFILAKQHVRGLWSYLGCIICATMAVCYIIALLVQKIEGRAIKKKEVAGCLFVIALGFAMCFF